jgi:hypothetical protein
MDLHGLLKFANDQQAARLRCVIDTGTNRSAAILLKIDEASIRRTIQAVRSQAADKGYSPEEDANFQAAEGFEVYGKTLRDPKTGSWLKTRKAEALADTMRFDDLVKRMEERALGLIPFKPQPAVAVEGNKLCNMFMFCDFHLGMHAWHKEGGADWDLKIAAHTFRTTLENMIARAPKADLAILAINGDFYHANGIEPLTPKSKHVLDVDGRWEKVKTIGTDLICDAIDRLLETHAFVKVLPIEGNHDPDAMVDMRVTLRRLYRDEPRVWINDSPLPYVALQFGSNMLCWHHGHLKNNSGLLEVFCSGTFRTIWGATEFTYIHTGHRHHKDREKGGAADLTQHSTMAARDANAARGGYVSARSASVTTYHHDFGIWNEAHISAKMLEAA